MAISMSTTRTFLSKNRASESLDPIHLMLKCILNLPQAFYEENFFSVAMKFSKSTFGPSFLGDKF